MDVESFLNAVEDSSPVSFLSYVKRHWKKTDGFNFSEAIDSLPRGQFTRLCTAVSQQAQEVAETVLTRHVISEKEEEEEEDMEEKEVTQEKFTATEQEMPSKRKNNNNGNNNNNNKEEKDSFDAETESVRFSQKTTSLQEEGEETSPQRRTSHFFHQQRRGEFLSSDEISVMKGLLIIIKLAILECKSIVFSPPDGLFLAVQAFHEILLLPGLNLSTRDSNRGSIQDSIARICESWWHGKLPGREKLITHTIPYLLVKSFKGKTADVQRVYAMKDALLLFDFQDESITDLKGFLFRCAQAPAYLRSSPGKFFLSFVLTLDAQLIREMVILIKNQIPSGRKSIVNAYGAILFRAWRDVTEKDSLFELEYSCIQTFCEAALYASSQALGASLRLLLGGFTNHKKQKGVDEMLLRISEPILFRALQAANPLVRQNAILLLVELFPLQNPDSPREENDILFNKQCTLLTKLLMDDSVSVRCTAVREVCVILAKWWAIIPSSTVRLILTSIVEELANDSANSIRSVVLEGIAIVMTNHHTHGKLMSLLPKLTPRLDDAVLKVRLKAVDLLLEIQHVSAIKVLEVINLDSVLKALETDEPVMARSLTRLLLPIFFSPSLPIHEAVHPFLVLLKRSPPAGAVFARWLLDEGVPLEPVSRLVKVLVKTLLFFAKKEERRRQRNGKNVDNSRKKCKEWEFGGSEQGSSPSGKKGKGVRLSDPDWQDAILLALSELCVKVTEKVGPESIAEIGEDNTLEVLLDSALTPKGRALVLKIASCLPPSELSTLVAYCGEKLMDFDIVGDLTHEKEEEIKSIIQFVASWGGLIDFVEALRAALVSANRKSRADSMPKTSKKRIRDEKRIARKSFCSVEEEENLPIEDPELPELPELPESPETVHGDEDERPAASKEDKNVDGLMSSLAASRYIEIILMDVNTREKLLECGPECEKLLQVLKGAAKAVFGDIQENRNEIRNGSSCLQINCRMLPAAPVLAYVNLAIQLTIKKMRDEDDGNGEDEGYGGVKAGSSQASEKRRENEKIIQKILEELVNWALDALYKLQQKPVSSSTRATPPLRKLPREYSRKSSRQQKRHSLPPLPECTTGGTEQTTETSKSYQDRHSRAAVVFTATLVILADAMFLSLVKEQKLCLEFAQKAVLWLNKVIIDNFVTTERNTESNRKVNHGGSQSFGRTKSKEDYPWLTLIASALSHAAKIVHYAIKEKEFVDLKAQTATIILNFLAYLTSQNQLTLNQFTTVMIKTLRPWLVHLLTASMEGSNSTLSMGLTSEMHEGNLNEENHNLGSGTTMEERNRNWIEIIAIEVTAVHTQKELNSGGQNDGLKHNRSSMFEGDSSQPSAENEEGGESVSHSFSGKPTKESQRRPSTSNLGTGNGPQASQGNENSTDVTMEEDMNTEGNIQSQSRQQNALFSRLVLLTVKRAPTLKKTFVSYLIFRAVEVQTCKNMPVFFGIIVLLVKMVGGQQGSGRGNASDGNLLSSKELAELKSMKMRMLKDLEMLGEKNHENDNDGALIKTCIGGLGNILGD